MDLKRLRKKIDQLDNDIIARLNQRAKIALEIAKLKKRQGKSVYSPEREKEIINRLLSRNKGPLSQAAITGIYREIMSAGLSLERPLKIAYLGPEATFTHIAALNKFGSQVEYIACNTITDVFLAVDKGNADYGVVPIENSFEGAVTHTLDMFVDSDLKICSQILVNVSHNLLGKCSINKIRRVYSNPQVFGQCRFWLEENLPHAEKIEVTSTSRAAQIAAREKNTGCIASFLAASVYGLKVVAKGIEYSPNNITRFLVIGREQAGYTGNDRTPILFSIKDKVGALHDMLVPFKKYGINLSKIESRPSKRKAWDYYFFVDLEGHCEEARVKKALKALEQKCRFLKILGSYPKGE